MSSDGEATRVDVLDEILPYRGTDDCEYDCDEDANVTIVARRDGQRGRWNSCLSCAQDNGFRPIANDWVDESELEEFSDE